MPPSIPTSAPDVILPAGTKEQLLARNFERLEAVIAANRKGMQAGEAVATTNVTKAIAEQNKMLGVTNGAVNNFTVNTGQQGDGSNNRPIEIHFPKVVERPDGSVWIEGKVPDDPPPEPLRLLEYRPSSDAVPLPPEALPRHDPPSPPGESGPRTELDLPSHQRFGFSASDESRLWKKRPRNW